MIIPAVVDQNGQPIKLDQQLGSPGGEGTVYSVGGDTAWAAKIYHAHLRSAERFEKVKALIGATNPKLLSVAAWPKALLFEARSRQPIGFVMPRLSADCQPIQQLYNPVQRLKFFPRSGWHFQVRAAQNIAAAFEEVHRAGCLMGDVNERNELVSSQASVKLIDCDSFQVRNNGRSYLCEVGVAQYTPPELQGKSFQGLVRTENHDRFGIAVLIYQLLFVGRHPYAGLHSDEASPEDLIARYRFSQGPAAHTWGMAPPPHTPTFSDIPLEIGALFRRAFERGSEKGTRPTAAEWLTALQRLEREIAKCPADPGHQFWRGAKSCVWCRLANHGPEYYFGVAGGAGSFAVNEAKLQEILKRLASAQQVDLQYDRKRFVPAKRPQAEPIPGDVQRKQSSVKVVGFSGLGCLLMMPLGAIHRAFFFAALLSAMTFWIWFAIALSFSPWHQERRRRQQRFSRATQTMKDLEANWMQNVRRDTALRTKLIESIHQLAGDCRGLAGKYATDLRQLTANAEALARTRHLRLHLISDANIPNIGAGRTQSLATRGIYSAADVDPRVIFRIKGFGSSLTGNLVAWRDQILAQFRFDPKTAMSPNDQRAAAARFRSQEQQFHKQMEHDLQKIAALGPASRTELEKLVPQLRGALVTLGQARVDLAEFE
ncbi:MAG: helix-hairpin-helix domain-containing protein [Gemmataceae bacterium]